MALFDALAGAIAYHKEKFGNTGCGKRAGSIEPSGFSLLEGGSTFKPPAQGRALALTRSSGALR